jgi:predicted Zn-dependent peptidase
MIMETIKQFTEQKIKEYVEEQILKLSQNKGGTTVIQQANSPAEELKKFKELLDMGIITQEEFDTKKKQLLGL